ncbi:hypothetical protein [Lactobacillus gallinarum] [Lactiplantibacillus mudanjiangensis]|nr:hypothetical protein [Lactobacillus gallinarum] [Lactiplantibacillus mudanjiangensis]
MSYNTHSDNITNQVTELIENILPNTVTNIKNISSKKVDASYSYVYFIHYLTNRAELKTFVSNTYLDVSLSFYKEAYIAMLLGQKSAYTLLLRSSLENFIKYMLEYYCLEIDPTRFKQNVHTLRSSSSFPNTLITELDSFIDIYHDYSGLSHSVINRNINIISYLEAGTKEKKQNFTDNLEQLRKMSKKYGYFLIYICKSSLQIWDTNDLLSMLSIIYSSSQTSSIITTLKRHSVEL